MKKFILLIGISILLIASCGVETNASQEERFEKLSHEDKGVYRIDKLKDTITGCQYVVAYHSKGISMTPLVGRDGLPICY